MKDSKNKENLMKKYFSRVAIAIIVLVMVPSVTPVFAQPLPSINPSSVALTLLMTDPPSSAAIAKTIQTPIIPPKPDIVFLSDTTGGMGPAIGAYEPPPVVWSPG